MSFMISQRKRKKKANNKLLIEPVFAEQQQSKGPKFEKYNFWGYKPTSDEEGLP